MLHVRLVRFTSILTKPYYYRCTDDSRDIKYMYILWYCDISPTTLDDPVTFSSLNWYFKNVLTSSLCVFWWHWRTYVVTSTTKCLCYAANSEPSFDVTVIHCLHCFDSSARLKSQKKTIAYSFFTMYIGLDAAWNAILIGLLRFCNNIAYIILILYAYCAHGYYRLCSLIDVYLSK